MPLSMGLRPGAWNQITPPRFFPHGTDGGVDKSAQLSMEKPRIHGWE